MPNAWLTSAFNCSDSGKQKSLKHLAVRSGHDPFWANYIEYSSRSLVRVARQRREWTQFNLIEFGAQESTLLKPFPGGLGESPVYASSTMRMVGLVEGRQVRRS
jgi:hypothetical protein